MPATRIVSATAIATMVLLAAGCDPEPETGYTAEEALDDEPEGEREGADEFAIEVDPSEAPSTCCVAHTGPKCDNPSVASCVCAADPYCCTTHWDSICVREVETLDCGNCGSPESCCTAHSAPGCGNDPVEDCVCATDSYCCSTHWDSICVGEVESLGCGTCSQQCGTPQQINAILTAFEPCASGNSLGQNEGISGVTCDQVCCAFGFDDCEYRGAQAGYDACNPTPAPATGTCGQVFAPAWSSQCVCS